MLRNFDFIADAEPDPATQNDADLDPQPCVYIITITENSNLDMELWRVSVCPWPSGLSLLSGPPTWSGKGTHLVTQLIIKEPLQRLSGGPTVKECLEKISAKFHIS